MEIPFCLRNEISSKHFIKKFDEFANNIFDVRIKWLMQKVKILFTVKDKSSHQACKIYKSVCSCGKSYIGETVKNVEEHWGEHSNPSKHISDNVDQTLHRSVLARASTNTF